MNKLDLQNIIDTYNLDQKEVAKNLFPKNKYPELALNRVLARETYLDTEQASKLALIIGVPIEKLFSTAKWSGKRVGATHILTNGEYRAELDSETWTTKIFHNDSLFHDEVLHSGTTSLSKYLSKLDELILNHKYINT